jgi:hypothetical protein
MSPLRLHSRKLLSCKLRCRGCLPHALPLVLDACLGLVGVCSSGLILLRSLESFFSSDEILSSTNHGKTISDSP